MPECYFLQKSVDMYVWGRGGEYGQTEHEEMSSGDLRAQADPSSSSDPAEKDINPGQLFRWKRPLATSSQSVSSCHHEMQERLSNLPQDGLQ